MVRSGFDWASPRSSRTAAARFGTPNLVYARLRCLETVVELNPAAEGLTDRRRARRCSTEQRSPREFSGANQLAQPRQ